MGYTAERTDIPNIYEVKFPNGTVERMKMDPITGKIYFADCKNSTDRSTFPNFHKGSVKEAIQKCQSR